MLNQSLKLPSELLAEIENFIKENKQLGFTTKEEFIRDAARWQLTFLREESEYVEIPREKYERLDAAVKEMNTPYRGAEGFINIQIEEVLEKYNRWLEEKEEHEKRQRKR
jgi:metal-responsive CopG/Arc/MetJ family transcriptional regulator